MGQNNTCYSSISSRKCHKTSHLAGTDAAIAAVVADTVASHSDMYDVCRKERGKTKKNTEDLDPTCPLQAQGTPQHGKSRKNGAEFLGGSFGYSFFFLLGGRGRGSLTRQKGPGVGFLLKIPRGGGLPGEGGEGPGGCLCGIWVGGGGEYFLSGPKFPPRFAKFPT